MSSFLLPMLDLNPDKRALARQSLNHPWLQEGTTSSSAMKSTGSRSTEINGSNKPLSRSDTSGDKSVKRENRKSEKNENLERRHSGYYKLTTKANDVKVDPNWKY